MQIRVLKTFSYRTGQGDVRVPRGLLVDLPQEVAEAAIADGKAADPDGLGGAEPDSHLAELDDVVDLDDMSHADLLALAEDRGVEVKKSDSKAVIAAAIKAHK